ncbi:dopamine receptor 1-like [Diadema antillarum]|uniref:dopamine receptor 1-like n=1 Tax=Diadema antillarum TaxID=105358 RepID=UPI003A857698
MPNPLQIGDDEAGRVVWVPLIDAVLVFIIVASVFGNLLVCIAIAIDRDLRKPSNLFIGSLAVADLLVALLVMPVSLSTDLIPSSIFGDVLCKAWICADIVFSSASLWHLLLISIDRYLHIKKPFLYKRWMTNTVAIATIATLWLVTIAKTCIPVYLDWYSNGPSTGHNATSSLVWKSQSVGDTGSSGWTLAGFIYCDHAYNFTFSIVSSCMDFFFPSIVMVTVYARVYLIVRNRAKKLRSGHLDASKRHGGRDEHTTGEIRVSNQNASDVKALITLGTIIGLFLLCWSPFFYAA